MSNATENAYVELKHISKTFGTVAANKNISLSVRRGEIHALLGENGSGKSTLVNILSGIYTPDGGEIYIGGQRKRFHSPKDAIACGIGMVHQHFKLVEVMTAQQNIVGGSKCGFFLQPKKIIKKIEDIAQKYSLSVNAQKKIYRMAVSEKQSVEILKMLYRGADILILDEPTAVLTPQEVTVLFDILRRMKQQGCAVIIITHKMNEVMEISDRVTVLRQGEFVATVDTAGTDPHELIEMMVGRPIKLEIECAESDKQEENVLCVEGLEKLDESTGIKVLNNMSFSLGGGEILGVAGIAGSGQKELCEILAGLQKASAGSVKYKGGEILGMEPMDIIRKGISMSFIPEDRLGMGLVAGMDVSENVLLKSYKNKKGMLVDRASGRETARQIVKKFNISTPSVSHIVRKLSGGNIQKVLLGREVSLNPNLLITAYPVRGLDIGASYQIYDILNEQKKKGVAILFIGEDLDVLLQLCDRLMVIHDGAVMDIVDPRSVTKEQVGLLMLGNK